MRVLMCGDRDWTDASLIDSVLMGLVYQIAIEGNGPLVIIEGEARGADSIARDRAQYHGIEVEAYPADWTRWGKRAGYLRNQEMLDKGKPDVVLAFHDDIAHSKGTKMMIEIAQKAGVPTRVISHE